ncbi:2-dehydropantoate 2-reductase [Streptomyces caelestis]|uniref:2-dehydropantoate 2-reductase n=1 Tax=Streptomyces caelestis TaxID=36816 RepID=UPI003652091D
MDGERGGRDEPAAPARRCDGGTHESPTVGTAGAVEKAVERTTTGTAQSPAGATSILWTIFRRQRGGGFRVPRCPSTGRSSPRQKVAVLGAGTIGAYVGAAPHRAGAGVHLIARGPHLAAMRRYGVRVRSPRGDPTAHPRATDEPAEAGPADYVFPGLRADSYAACGPLIEPPLHDTAAVVAARNGIPWWYVHRHGGPYDGRRPESVDPGGAVSAVLAPERAVGRVVHTATELERPGVVRHGEGTRFSLGEPDRSVSARCPALGEARRAGA